MQSQYCGCTRALLYLYSWELQAKLFRTEVSGCLRLCFDKEEIVVETEYGKMLVVKSSWRACVILHHTIISTLHYKNSNSKKLGNFKNLNKFKRGKFVWPNMAEILRYRNGKGKKVHSFWRITGQYLPKFLNTHSFWLTFTNLY